MGDGKVLGGLSAGGGAGAKFSIFGAEILPSNSFQERKISPKRKFSAGHPCGHPTKNFDQARQILENKAFWHGRPVRTSTKKLRSEKLRAEFSFHIFASYLPNCSYQP